MCHVIIPVNERHCPAHKEQHDDEWQRKKNEYRKSKLGQMLKAQKAKQYDQTERDPEAVEFYHSKQWQSVRDYVYSRDMATCQSCGNVVQDRKIIDHIIPRRLCSAQEALDSSNLWTLCYKCHYRKTKLEQIISKEQNGDIILAHLDRAWWTKVLREKKEVK
ncbi:HNH endonuclease [Schleiferilactobacillus harbinensis]|uniref:HNH endonuclease n=1 Tax=Schleiferilactobacillus harbinensis TaxID=304207 RepID=UPI001F389089|nr:HNH endonuclease [Schleiferilactobacillus harbinensis]